jgi:hypothetical protein
MYDVLKTFCSVQYGWIDRTHGGHFCDHGHFVYGPLKYVQNFGAKLTFDSILAQSFRVSFKS